MASKPSSVIGWVPDPGDIEEPSGGEKSTGWQPDQRPPAQQFNWFWNNVSQWIDYVNDQVFTGSVTIPVLVAGTASVGAVAFNGLITPPDLPSAASNDYAPTGIDTAHLVRLTGHSGGTSIITGIDANQTQGRLLVLRNVNTFAIGIGHEDATSAAANRISLAEGVSDVSMIFNGVISLMYDGTSSRWIEIGRNGGVS